VEGQQLGLGWGAARITVPSDAGAFLATHRFSLWCECVVVDSSPIVRISFMLVSGGNFVEAEELLPLI
jgi:hypothetical protein